MFYKHSRELWVNELIVQWISFCTRLLHISEPETTDYLKITCVIFQILIRLPNKILLTILRRLGSDHSFAYTRNIPIHHNSSWAKDPRAKRETKTKGLNFKSSWRNMVSWQYARLGSLTICEIRLPDNMSPILHPLELMRGTAFVQRIYGSLTVWPPTY